MGSWILYCAALCLLGAGPLDTAVSQTPKHLVAQAGNEVSLKCEQNLGHNAMYWYKQDTKQLLKAMFSYYNKELTLNETVPSRFSPDSPDKAHLDLHVRSLEPDDSAVYLCASSQDTALQSHLLPVHKPLARRKLWGKEFPVPKAPFPLHLDPAEPQFVVSPNSPQRLSTLSMNANGFHCYFGYENPAQLSNFQNLVCA